MLLCSLALVGLACLLASPLSRPLGGNAGWVLSLPLLGAAALLILAFTGSDGVPVQHLDWIPSLGVGLDLRLDGLAWMFAGLVLAKLYFPSHSDGLSQFLAYATFAMGFGTAITVAAIALVVGVAALFIGYSARDIARARETREAVEAGEL